MSKNFYWSDPHFGHKKVAELRGFDSVMEHDQHLANSWLDKVSKRDTVWILGDLALSSPSTALEIIGSLPGAKHLIAGNHDQIHPMHRTAHRTHVRYMCTFESIQTMARHKILGQEFLLSHFPYAGDHAGTPDRYTQWRLRDEGLPLIHGHVHDEWLHNGRQINVGVDHWLDGPASADQIMDIYKETQK